MRQISQQPSVTSQQPQSFAKIDDMFESLGTSYELKISEFYLHLVQVRVVKLYRLESSRINIIKYFSSIDIVVY